MGNLIYSIYMDEKGENRNMRLKEESENMIDIGHRYGRGHKGIN